MPTSPSETLRISRSLSRRSVNRVLQLVKKVLCFLCWPTCFLIAQQTLPLPKCISFTVLEVPERVAQSPRSFGFRLSVKIAKRRPNQFQLWGWEWWYGCLVLWELDFAKKAVMLIHEAAWDWCWCIFLSHTFSWPFYSMIIQETGQIVEGDSTADFFYLIFNWCITVVTISLWHFKKPYRQRFQQIQHATSVQVEVSNVIFLSLGLPLEIIQEVEGRLMHWWGKRTGCGWVIFKGLRAEGLFRAEGRDKIGGALGRFGDKPPNWTF